MVNGNIGYAIHHVHLPCICQDINHKERVTNITKSRAVLTRHPIKMHLMYVRSITHTYLKRKGMGLCSKNGTISSQWKERQPNSFMWSQVLLKTVKHGVTVTAESDGTDTSDGLMPSSYSTRHLVWVHYVPGHR